MTGASVLALVVLLGFVAAGVVVSVSVGVVVAALVASSELAALRARLRRFLVGAASAVLAVGCVEALEACWAAALADAARASVASSPGRLELACDGLGAGPIAAPTATPIPSIAAASAAVTRAEGARKGDFWLSGVLFIEWSGIIVNREHGPDPGGSRPYP